jgi:hypothetical protein
VSPTRSRPVVERGAERQRRPHPSALSPEAEKRPCELLRSQMIGVLGPLVYGQTYGLTVVRERLIPNASGHVCPDWRRKRTCCGARRTQLGRVRSPMPAFHATANCPRRGRHAGARSQGATQEATSSAQSSSGAPSAIDRALIAPTRSRVLVRSYPQTRVRRTCSFTLVRRRM